LTSKSSMERVVEMDLSKNREKPLRAPKLVI
jgi:hypothetical protein